MLTFLCFPNSRHRELFQFRLHNAHSKAYFFISIYFIDKVYSLHYKDHVQLPLSQLSEISHYSELREFVQKI